MTLYSIWNSAFRKDGGGGGMSNNEYFKIGESFTGDSPFPYLEVIDDGPDFSKLVVGGVCLRKQLLI